MNLIKIKNIDSLPSFIQGMIDTSLVGYLTTIPLSTSTIVGGRKLFSDTIQTVAASAVSATASRTYGVQVNSAGQMVVNVPWVDTNSNTTYTAGTGLTLTGTAFSVNYGTAAGTAAQGNDSRINNGQTAFGWGDHASAGYAASSHTHTFASLTSKPTTLAGYGITDAGISGVVSNVATGTTDVASSTNGNTYINRLQGGVIKETVRLVGAGGTTITHATGGVITITSANTNTTYTAGNGLTLSGTTFSLPVTDSGSGNYVSNVVASASGLTVTKASLPVPSLVTTTTATGTTNATTTNTNTFLNIVENGASVGSSTQITGAGSVTVSSDTAGKLTITGTAGVSTRIKGGDAGVFTSGDVTLTPGVNINIVQNGSNITISTPLTSYYAGTGITLTDSTFSLPITVSGSGNYISNIDTNTNGLTVTKSNLPVPSLITSTSSTGLTNIATGNTNTYLNIVENGASVGSSTQITGAGSVTVSSDAAGKLTITGTNTTYSTETLTNLNTGTSSTGLLQSAKNLNDWANSKYISKNILSNRSNTLDGITGGSDFFYSPSTDTAKPSGVVDGSVMSMSYDSDKWYSQIYSDWRNNDWYVRTKNNGVWTSFSKLYHSGNFNPSDYSVTSHTHTFASLTSKPTTLAGYGITDAGISGVVSNVATGTTDVASSTNGNTYINRLQGGVIKETVRLVGAGGTTITHAIGGVITITSANTNTTYTAGTGLTLTGTVFSVNYGTAAGTAAQGNDSRIVNGQTAFGWGNHAAAGYLTSVATATSSILGLTKLFSDTIQTVASNAVSATASRTYGVQLNNSGQMVVNVPWTDTNTNTTYSAGTGMAITNNVIYWVLYGNGSTAGAGKYVSKITQVQGGMSVEYETLPTSSSPYTLPVATSTTLGGVELFSDTIQTVASNAVSTTASRTYGIQLNSAGQMVVNVPWTNSNTTYTASTGLLLTGTAFSVNYGTAAGTAAQGNDSRINNGQTAFDWGNHSSVGYLTSVPAATATTNGIRRLYSNTVQSVVSNAVSATAGRTYGVQVNSSGQMVVNVPWVEGSGTPTTLRTIYSSTISGNILFQTSGNISISTSGNTMTFISNTPTINIVDIGHHSITDNFNGLYDSKSSEYIHNYDKDTYMGEIEVAVMSSSGYWDNPSNNYVEFYGEWGVRTSTTKEFITQGTIVLESDYTPLISNGEYYVIGRQSTSTLLTVEIVSFSTLKSAQISASTNANRMLVLFGKLSFDEGSGRCFIRVNPQLF